MSEWISVDDGMPEIGEIVVTAGYRPVGDRMTWTVQQDELEETITGEAVWRASRARTVRWWMRLPELPGGQRIGGTAVMTCPHCGGTACVYHSEPADSQDETWMWHVVCDECGAQSGWCPDIDTAVRKWNRRS